MNKKNKYNKFALVDDDYPNIRFHLWDHPKASPDFYNTVDGWLSKDRSSCFGNLIQFGQQTFIVRDNTFIIPKKKHPKDSRVLVYIEGEILFEGLGDNCNILQQEKINYTIPKPERGKLKGHMKDTDSVIVNGYLLQMGLQSQIVFFQYNPPSFKRKYLMLSNKPTTSNDTTLNYNFDITKIVN